MPDTPSITINKQFTYRGQPEIWSNTYHFSGTVPNNDAAWNTLATAIWGAEALMFPGSIKYAGYLGYVAGNEHAVSIRNLVEEGGTLPAGTGSGFGTDGDTNSTTGDTAFWVRWATPDRTSRGKRIYLRKYFHGALANGDLQNANQKGKAAQYGAKMTDGTLPGGFKICGPQGAVAGAVAVSPFLTTRTLKRRGKRPSS